MADITDIAGASKLTETQLDLASSEDKIGLVSINNDDNYSDNEPDKPDESIAVWSRYSAHLSDAWEYEHCEEDASEGYDYNFEDVVGHTGACDGDTGCDNALFRQLSSRKSEAWSRNSVEIVVNSDIKGYLGLSQARFKRHSAPLLSYKLPDNNSGIFEASAVCSEDGFWAITAALLGPDFGFNSGSFKKQIEQSEEPTIPKRARSNALLQSISKPRPDLSRRLTEPVLISGPVVSTVGNQPTSSKTGSKATIEEALKSLDQTWHYFATQASVQAYIDTLKHSHNFGVCFINDDGSRCCCMMRAREQKRIYSLPADYYWDTRQKASNYEFPDPDCQSLFWWCRPESLKSETGEYKSTQEELGRRYESAKLQLMGFRSTGAPTKSTKEELRTAYDRLSADLPKRTKLMGRYSTESMNTVLQLCELSEALGISVEAEKWGRELVSRRTRRLGRSSEHTCQARYKLCTLLLNNGDYDAARDVSRENLLHLHDAPPTDALVVRQSVQACMIALKRRRIDQAMDVLLHLWTLERWHEKDLKTRDEALGILSQACAFRHQFVAAEAWVRKRIKLFDGQLPDTKGGFDTTLHRASVYFDLATYLNKQDLNPASVEVARISLNYYKATPNISKYDVSVCAVYYLLGKLFYDLKDWNRARFYLEKAAHGYLERVGQGDERTVKSRELLACLEKSMRVRQGLAERLAKQREREREKAAKKHRY